ncbi:uncharacterized protein CLUP02_03419 [Colletotrichum lupini]|uniref:Uncharacterized protein n=1 Tax=Colletotrichum lupini TaxID=145971 RepID=A0A9Q8WCB9_9PEZI|nr:uncharacterized protein CLUP02_03419 [Colletotrichum lupini]UQC77946.1 hypothetical protein CLUP02_03419 [Colletotrichum lupini]
MSGAFTRHFPDCIAKHGTGDRGTLHTCELRTTHVQVQVQLNGNLEPTPPRHQYTPSIPSAPKNGLIHLTDLDLNLLPLTHDILGLAESSERPH